MGETVAAIETTPSDERVEVTRIRARFPGDVIEVREFRGDTWLTVRRERIVDILQLLRDDPDLAYSFLSECLGVDYLDARTGDYILGKDHRFEVVYNLYSLPNSLTGAGHNRRFFVKVGVPEDDPVVPSVVSVYPGAEFPEREIYDMFGVTFEGHPDLRRILMADDWQGHPQRKDYPLGGERVQFPGGTLGPSVGEGVVQHPGESFTGKTASEMGDTD
jgi:NADH-quinone oxidoreductase subunit C